MSPEGRTRDARREAYGVRMTHTLGRTRSPEPSAARFASALVVAGTAFTVLAGLVVASIALSRGSATVVVLFSEVPLAAFVGQLLVIAATSALVVLLIGFAPLRMLARWTARLPRPGVRALCWIAAGAAWTVLSVTAVTAVIAMLGADLSRDESFVPFVVVCAALGGASSGLAWLWFERPPARGEE